jgi:hypothetical protein
MDFHFNKQELSDGRLDFIVRPSGVPPLQRSHSVRQRAELEHAFVESLKRRGNWSRAGVRGLPVLAKIQHPRGDRSDARVGIINERHEPPIYYGSGAPFVVHRHHPTTWFETGVACTAKSAAVGDIAPSSRLR